MKKLIGFALLSLVIGTAALAEGTQYRMRVDGLACPYCAYGIEKNLKKIDGVEKIDFDLDNGLVTVNVAEGATLTEKQMTKLFKDSGFTFRSMVMKPLDEAEAQ